jgi:hypothetical protein
MHSKHVCGVNLVHEVLEKNRSVGGSIPPLGTIPLTHASLNFGAFSATKRLV